LYTVNPLSYVPAELQSVVFGLAAAVVAMVVFGFSPRPLRFALGIGVMLASGNLLVSVGGAFNADFMRRSFFGVHRVIHEPEANVFVLMHGMTVHGAQAVDRAGWHEPLGYYIEDGPIGQLFGRLHEDPAPREVGIVGLGSGGLTCYRRKNDRFVFYEIDMAVLEIARDERFFHYLGECGGATNTILGDARLSLVAEPDGRFDMLVIDAFSSDSIPVNLITREAVELYLRKLSADGILAVHVSNKFLDLEPVLGNVAAELNIAARIQEYVPAEDRPKTDAERTSGDAGAVYRFSSTWIALARDEHAMHAIAKDKRWRALEQDADIGLWTDDYSNIVKVLRW
jgi:spermidine synthase